MANITHSEHQFRLDQLAQGAKIIAALRDRTDQTYAEIVARFKAEAEADAESQERVDGLAESEPADLTKYPPREV